MSKSDLSNNRIGIRGLAYMTECIRSDFVEYIDLRFNNLCSDDLDPYLDEEIRTIVV